MPVRKKGTRWFLTWQDQEKISWNLHVERRSQIAPFSVSVWDTTYPQESKWTTSTLPRYVSSIEDVPYWMSFLRLQRNHKHISCLTTMPCTSHRVHPPLFLYGSCSYLFTGLSLSLEAAGGRLSIPTPLSYMFQVFQPWSYRGDPTWLCT